MFVRWVLGWKFKSSEMTKPHLTNAYTAILHESFIAGAYKRAKRICTGGVVWTGSIDLTFIHICRELITGGYIKQMLQGIKGKSLPMHTLPFFMNPSLQVHTKEPKIFAQVEWSGQVPLISHSSTSA